MRPTRIPRRSPRRCRALGCSRSKSSSAPPSSSAFQRHRCQHSASATSRAARLGASRTSPPRSDRDRVRVRLCSHEQRRTPRCTARRSRSAVDRAQAASPSRSRSVASSSCCSECPRIRRRGPRSVRRRARDPRRRADTYSWANGERAPSARRRARRSFREHDRRPRHCQSCRRDGKGLASQRRVSRDRPGCAANSEQYTSPPRSACCRAGVVAAARGARRWLLAHREPSEERQIAEHV
jgi:hypothetical protein